MPLPAFLAPPLMSSAARTPGAQPHRCVSRTNFSVSVYVVTDRRTHAARPVDEVVAAALQGDGRGNGATIVQ